jgi:hypothetical protein
MSELRIHVTGICAFTPGSPTPAGPLAGPLTFVLPAGTPRLSQRVADTVIPAHMPFLIARVSDVAAPLDGSRTSDARIMNADGQERAIWIFDRERLTIAPDPAGDITYQQGSTQTNQFPSGDETDVRWIADMRAIWPDASSIRTDCLPSAPSIASTVAMQLVIGSGHIASEFLSHTFLMARFDPQKAQLIDQTITREVLITRDLGSTQQVTISSHSLDGGAALGEIVLNVAAGADLDVIAGNLELGDIMALASGGTVDNPLGADTHFELYYPVLQTPPGDIVPIPTLHEIQGLWSNCPVLMTA